MKERIRKLLEEELKFIKGGLHPEYEEKPDYESDPSTTSYPKSVSSTRKSVSKEDVLAFADRCQMVIDDYNKRHGYVKDRILMIKMGRKLAKIVAVDPRRQEAVDDVSGSAWAFVDLSNGDILKAASWNAPAKHARGNIFDEYEGMKYIGPYGPAYLK